jgi:hypothetical protein
MMRSMGNGRIAIVAASALSLALATAEGARAQQAGRAPEGGSTGGSGHLRTARPGAPPGGTGGTNIGGGLGGNANFGQAGFNPQSVNGANIADGFGGNANFGQAGFNPLLMNPAVTPSPFVPGGGGFVPGAVGFGPTAPVGSFNPTALGGFPQAGNTIYGIGGGFGFGGATSPYGLSPYDEAMMRDQAYSLNASRYDLNTAQALAAYQAANFYNTMANAAAASNYKQSTGMLPYYNVQTTAARFAPTAGRAGAGTGAGVAGRSLLPRAQIIDEQGRVLWPAAAPTSPSDVAAARSGVDQAVRDIVREEQQGRRAPIRGIVAARDQIDAYRRSALEPLRTDSPADAQAVDLFLRSLDNAVVGMGMGTAGGGAAPGTVAQDLRPDDAPKTGGDVLKQSIKETRDRDEAPSPTRQPRTDNVPRTGGDVAKDAIQKDQTPSPR